ncbi:hypothetical protein [Lysinibacillus sp. BPa_S21]|uniref:hypothetical protein n=1 Tax=Lysinibacillus sp. BPa_S21 TaxID=2932478 RepID=UPI002012FB1F|nr:hypothetical protein [Lysinibacillus sp. BPa_S21]MCL1698349.1 hypothetical protein [Lysinibacillus sp. BPa_S21]
MFNLKKAMIILAFIFTIGSFPSITSACSCAYLPSVEEEFELSKAIFSGKVVDIKEKQSLKGDTTKSVLFEVTNTWKGVEQSQVIITTGQGGGDCGYNFIKGEEYLVYANESIMYGTKSLISTICNRTYVLSSSQEDLEILGEGQPQIEEVNLIDKHIRNQIYIWATVAVAIGIVVFFILNKRKRMDKSYR